MAQAVAAWRYPPPAGWDRPTVRDHVKAIFHKAGVSRRGQLIARLYADQYEPLHQKEALHISQDANYT
jgi:hypothetical protein